MRLLLHGNLTPAVSEALKRHHHTPVTPAEIELPAEAPPQLVLETAKAKQLDILTTDAALVSAVYDLDLYLFRSMIYLQLGGGDVGRTTRSIGCLHDTHGSRPIGCTR